MGQTLPKTCQALDCGGCQIQGLAYQTQLEVKTRLLKTALIRLGHFPANYVEERLAEIKPSPKITRYRNKMEFAFGLNANQEIILGQRIFHSNKVSQTPNCLLMPEDVGQILNLASHLAQKSQLQPFSLNLSKRSSPKATGFWRLFTVRSAYVPNSLKASFFAICLTSKANPKQVDLVRHIGQELLDSCPNLAGFVHEERSKLDTVAQGTLRHTILTKDNQEAYLELPLGQKRFLLDYAAFFQVNLEAAEFIWQILADFLADIKNDQWRLVDLYSGVGAPSLLLAHGFKAVLGFEINPQAVFAAQKNAKRFKLDHCNFKALPINLALDTIGQADIILADPPRSGLGAEICQAILRLAPKYIFYISCNPTTLARDLSLLASNYDIHKFYPIDLFPQTIHLETVVILTFKG